VFLGRVRGFIAWQIGGAILSAGLFQLCAIPLYSMVANRVDLRWLLMFGLACFGISMWLFTFLTNQWGWEEMLIPLVFRGLATPFGIASNVTLTLGGLPADRLKSASGLYTLMRSLGGAIGIAACGTILNDRTNLHFLRIAEHLTSTNTEMMNLLRGLTMKYSQAWGDLAGAPRSKGFGWSRTAKRRCKRSPMLTWRSPCVSRFRWCSCL
jgi:DHA2 family multidrug resistance protein